MPDSIKVRRAKVSDLPQLLDLINVSFAKSDNHKFEIMLPHLYADAAVATEQAYLAEIDGRLAGHVGVYPVTLNCGGIAITSGGIGAVGCHPDFRSRGVMSRLLPEAIRGMEEVGYDVSILWGNRTRYRRYGWDHCGRRLEWGFDTSAVALEGVQPIAMRPADPTRDLATLTNLWNTDTAGSFQSEASMSRLLLRPTWRFALTRDGRAMAAWEVEEKKLRLDKLIAPEADMPGLLLWLRQQADPKEGHLLVRCVPGDHPLTRMAFLMSEYQVQHWACQVRMIRPEQLAMKLNIDPALLLTDGAVQCLFGSPMDLPRSPAWATCPFDLPLPMAVERPAWV